MAELNQIYRCFICSNIVEAIHSGGGELVCCGKPMLLLAANAARTSPEMHLPVIRELPANICHGKDGVVVSIGSPAHPMNDAHYIEWIEIIIQDGRRGKKYLRPGDKSEVEFHTRGRVAGARAYCNLHGLWQT